MSVAEIITAQSVAREALRIFREHYQNPATGKDTGRPRGGQTGVDFNVLPSEMALPLPLFSDRYLKPAMVALAHGLPPGVKILADAPVIPIGIDYAATAESGGMAMRLTRGYDINTACLPRLLHSMRFDVRHT